MKALLIFFIVLIISTSVEAQPAPANDTPKSKAIVMPPDSLAIISIRDISIFFKWFRENVSVANYEKMTLEGILYELIVWSRIEYGKKKKK